MSPEYEKQMVDLLPKMRIWALHLTRNVSATDDLIQDVALKTLLAFEGFTPGTNFPAWVRRIMHNHFISSLRQRRNFIPLDDVPEASVAETQEVQINIRDLDLAFQNLSTTHKQALDSIALQDLSYEEVSHSTGVAVGTLKSRVHRARLQLRAQCE